jgi:hypothetical protein
VSELVPSAAAWARDHEACFEVTPLIELAKGQKVQVGVTIALYARLAMEKAPGQERRADASDIWKGLREILETLVPKEGSSVRLEVDAPRLAAFFRPENEMKPEIGLTARLFHGDDYLGEVTADEREKLTVVARRLMELGLKQGHW